MNEDTGMEPDVSDTAGATQLTDAIACASRATAAAMSALSDELATTFTERDLQGVFVIALRNSVRPLKLKVKPDRGVNFVQWQPPLGLWT